LGCKTRHRRVVFASRLIVANVMQIQRSTSTPSNIDRPQSGLSNRPLSRASVAPTLRPSSSLGHSRPISRVSQRPASRHSQRPASRQAHHAPAHSQISARVSGLIHTLVTQITGITNENDPENYKIAYDYANKHLELGMLGISGVVGISWDMKKADAHFAGCVRATIHLTLLFHLNLCGMHGWLMS
jgi:gamma-tubulin complex component 5